MVMHARKPQRITDGYFEKHQAHPYQNSKYSSSKGNYDGRYNHERMRDSPNGNSYRSDSPDSQSPRDRSYQTKNSYIQKIREKERENRDYKSRDKYSDCARSPKDKRSRESRDSEHRTNHDRSSSEVILHPIKVQTQNASVRESSQRKPLHNSCQDKREERERVARVGDWSEHISSSGKKYYYNCKTEVSQWEKPREWLERERDRDRDRGRDKGPRELDRGGGGGGSSSSYSSGGSSRTVHDKHSNSRSSLSSSRDALSKSMLPASASRQLEKREAYWAGQSGSSRDNEGDSHERRKHLDGESQAQDMDISPGDSTPTSETSYIHTPTGNNSCSQQQQQSLPVSTSEPGPVLLANALPRLASHPSHLMTSPASAGGRSTYQQPQTSQSQTVGKGSHSSSGSSRTSPGPQQQSQTSQASPAGSATPTMVPPAQANAPGPPVTLASLPRLLSQITGAKGLQSMEQAEALQTIQTALLLSRQALEPTGQNNQQHTPTSSAQMPLAPLKVDTSGESGVTLGEGPPTPTHSESQDCVDARKLASPPSSLSSLQSLAQAGVGGCSSLHALRPQGPHLTPSLANHYRDDLVNHVRGWPAEALEKQAQKLSEEGHTMGSLQCTRVSAELKTARSTVRLTEIQATLQEQRILFLRQQIETLEQLKSQNSFMSDDS